jgi:hypothetical protein
MSIAFSHVLILGKNHSNFPNITSVTSGAFKVELQQMRAPIPMFAKRLNRIVPEIVEK